MIVNDISRVLPLLILLISYSVTTQASIHIASQDTYSNGISPNSTYGTSGEMRVRSYGPSNGFLRFDVSSIASSTIDSATLSIDVLQVKKAGTIDIMVVNDSWDETTLNHANQPTLGSTIATVPVNNDDAGGSVSVSISNLVEQWVNGATENLGIALVSSSINVKLGTKESGSAATLNVTTSTNTPTQTHVSVPGDFTTINQAIAGLRDSWCPIDAKQCSIIVGPGYFDGFVCCDEDDVPLAVIGDGKNATIIGQTAISTDGGLELRDLTIDSDLLVDNLAGIDTPIKLIDVAIVGDGILLQDGANVDTGSEVILANVDANLLYIDLSSVAEITKSHIDLLSCNESRFSSRFSYLGMIDSFDCNVEVINSVIDNVQFIDKTLKVLQSEVRSGIELQGATGLFGNSRVSGGITDSGGSVMKCTNVLDENLNELPTSCSAIP